MVSSSSGQLLGQLELQGQLQGQLLSQLQGQLGQLEGQLLGGPYPASSHSCSLDDGRMNESRSQCGNRWQGFHIHIDRYVLLATLN